MRQRAARHLPRPRPGRRRREPARGRCRGGLRRAGGDAAVSDWLAGEPAALCRPSSSGSPRRSRRTPTAQPAPGRVETEGASRARGARGGVRAVAVRARRAAAVRRSRARGALRDALRLRRRRRARAPPDLQPRALVLSPSRTGARSRRPAPLRWHRLVELEPGETVATSPLRIDERVLHHLTGIDYLDERLQGLRRPRRRRPTRCRRRTTPSPPTLAAVCLRAAGRIRVRCSRSAAAIPTRAGRVAASACARLGLGLHALRHGDVPASAAERDAFARLWAARGGR